MRRTDGDEVGLDAQWAEFAIMLMERRNRETARKRNAETDQFPARTGTSERDTYYYLSGLLSVLNCYAPTDRGMQSAKLRRVIFETEREVARANCIRVLWIFEASRAGKFFCAE